MARSEREVLDHYLGSPVAPPEGYEGVHESTLHAALRDCRRAQNRDEWTGYLAPGEDADHFLGAVGYLCLIDQVSTAIGLRGGRYETGGLAREKAPYRALYDFTDLPAEVIEAMYGLRCSLAHDYSLVNKHRRQERQHLYSFFGGSELVQLPSADRRWDGEWVENFPGREATKFNMRRIGDVAEDVVSIARQHRSSASRGWRGPCVVRRRRGRDGDALLPVALRLLGASPAPVGAAAVSAPAIGRVA